ncbi:MAG: hypothetical protein WC974_03975 [Thermoplasmata archaeon]
MICAGCGKVIKGSEEYCSECAVLLGQSTSQKPETQAAPQQPAEKREPEGAQFLEKPVVKTEHERHMHAEVPRTVEQKEEAIKSHLAAPETQIVEPSAHLEAKKQTSAEEVQEAKPPAHIASADSQIAERKVEVSHPPAVSHSETRGVQEVQQPLHRTPPAAETTDRTIPRTDIERQRMPLKGFREPEVLYSPLDTTMEEKAKRDEEFQDEIRMLREELERLKSGTPQPQPQVQRPQIKSQFQPQIKKETPLSRETPSREPITTESRTPTVESKIPSPQPMQPRQPQSQVQRPQIKSQFQPQPQPQIRKEIQQTQQPNEVPVEVDISAEQEKVEMFHFPGDTDPFTETEVVRKPTVTEPVEEPEPEELDSILERKSPQKVDSLDVVDKETEKQQFGRREHITTSPHASSVRSKMPTPQPTPAPLQPKATTPTPSSKKELEFEPEIEVKRPRDEAKPVGPRPKPETKSPSAAEMKFTGSYKALDTSREKLEMKEETLYLCPHCKGEFRIDTSNEKKKIAEIGSMKEPEKETEEAAEKIVICPHCRKEIVFGPTEESLF